MIEYMLMDNDEISFRPGHGWHPRGARPRPGLEVRKGGNHTGDVARPRDRGTVGLHADGGIRTERWPHGMRGGSTRPGWMPTRGSGPTQPALHGIEILGSLWRIARGNLVSCVAPAPAAG